jgi:ligand-binding SRPBCC domain-containing protein
MTTFRFEAEQVIPRPRATMFPFFADAFNLQAITPPWLDFRIVTPQPIVMAVGTLIDYRLRVHGLPLRWRTRIAEWNPPSHFADEQLRGPYRLWYHEHMFEPVQGGTRMRDRVRYAVWGGRLVNRLLVRRDIERIFAYRTAALRKLFPA